jgi:hypothetical protein
MKSMICITNYTFCALWSQYRARGLRLFYGSEEINKKAAADGLSEQLLGKRLI